MIGNNPKISVDQLVFKSLYYRYKAFVTPLICIFVCVLLFYFVVLGQIQNFLLTQDALAVDRQSLTVLQQNLQTVTRLNDAALGKNLELATAALPTEKDFSGIVSALQNAAAQSGVIIGDYSLPLGDLSGADIKKAESQIPISINVAVKGSPQDAQKFIHALREQLPISDVTAVVGGGNQTVVVTILFYFSPLPKIVFKDTSPLPVFGNADAKILTDLENPSGQVTPAPTTSPIVSASPTPGVTLSPSPTAVATQSAQ